MKKIAKYDLPLIIITVLLALFGVIMIFSASNYSAVLQFKVSEYYFAVKQLICICVALFVGLIIMRLPLNTYRRFYRFFIWMIIAVLIALSTYGTISHNAQSWFKIFGFSIQPSEFTKTIIILYLAFAYGQKKQFKSTYDAFMPLIPCVFAFALIFIEPDRGTAIIVALICMFIFFSLPFSNDKTFKIIRNLFIIVAGATLIGINLLQGSFEGSVVLNRLNFRNPCSRYSEATGYQVCNGYIAINNGGLFGVGLGKSTQKYLYLPEAHTDFIYAIIVEELGFITGFIILILYIIILYRILIIARNAGNLTGSIIAYGTFAYIFIHIFVNLGGMLALIPLTGVPLPFLSYGGSFTLNLFILLALTQRVAYESKNKERRN